MRKTVPPGTTSPGGAFKKDSYVDMSVFDERSTGNVVVQYPRKNFAPPTPVQEDEDGMSSEMMALPVVSCVVM